MMPFGVSEKFARTKVGNDLRIHLASAERLHQHAYGFSHADGISKLHFAALGQTGSHNVLRDVARHVGSGTIHLRRILAAECAATVTTHAAVGVDDDLAAGQVRCRPSVRQLRNVPWD